MLWIETQLMLQPSYNILSTPQHVQYKKTIVLSSFEQKLFPQYLSLNLQFQGA